MKKTTPNGTIVDIQLDSEFATLLKKHRLYTKYINNVLAQYNKDKDNVFIRNHIYNDGKYPIIKLENIAQGFNWSDNNEDYDYWTIKNTVLYGG